MPNMTKSCAIERGTALLCPMPESRMHEETLKRIVFQAVNGVRHTVGRDPGSGTVPGNPSRPARLLRRPLRAPVTRGDPGTPHPSNGTPQGAELRKKPMVAGATHRLDGGLGTHRAAWPARAPSPCSDPPEDQRKAVRAKGCPPRKIGNQVQQREEEQEVGKVAAREL